MLVQAERIVQIGIGAIHVRFFVVLWSARNEGFHC